MKLLWMIFIFAFMLFGAQSAKKSCSMCALNKTQLKCDYYVDKNGDASKIRFCKEYADYLADSKIYGKAAWYYLLSKETGKAIKSSLDAIRLHELFAYEYLTFAYLINNDLKKASLSYLKLKKNVKNIDFFIHKDLKTLSRLYIGIDKKFNNLTN